MWWLKDPERLKREVADMDVLREHESWLAVATPHLLKDLKFAFKFDVVVEGETFPFTLEYPAFFPTSPPLVIPRDGRRLSNHQYGDGGELCLEHRADNWDPSITGAMMVASAYRLLAGELPAKDERAEVPSAHDVSPGQRLRGRYCRFLSTPGLCAYAAGLPAGSLRVGQVVEIKAAGDIWTAYVARLGSPEAPEWQEIAIPDRGYKQQPALLLRIEYLNDVPASPDQKFLDGLIKELRDKQGTRPSSDFRDMPFIVIADAVAARMFFSYPKDGLSALS